MEDITEDNLSDIADVKYVSTKKTSTLGEILGIGGGDVSLNAAGTAAKILDTYTKNDFKFTENGSALRTVTAAAVDHKLSITGSGKADKITGTAYADTIYGAKGNDTLTGGNGKDLFIYKSGDGNDLITDFTTGDKISLNTAYSNVTLSGSDVVFTIGKGSLTLKKAKGKTMTLIDSKGKESTLVVDTTLTLTDSNNSAVTIGAAIEKVNASKRTKAIKIVGNALNNSISGGSGKDTLSGGIGNDKLYGNAGNDSLLGGSGKDIFVYKPGEGIDKIMDYWYDEGDMLKILKTNGTAGGTFTSASFDGDALTLAISGGGSVVFENVSLGDKININNKTYTIKGRTLK